MRIVRSINNNVALAVDSTGREAVVFGKGIGFHAVPYEIGDDDSRVQKRFYEVNTALLPMMETLSEDALFVSSGIVDLARESLGCVLNPNLPFTLADHIQFAISCAKDGVVIENPLSAEIGIVEGPAVASWRLAPAEEVDGHGAVRQIQEGRPGGLNCLPFLGHGNRSPRDGRLSMSIDLRRRHDRSLRERAAEMFAAGRGHRSVARSLEVPVKTVKKWQYTYRAVGRGGLLAMGESHATYDFETKVAAASAVVDGGMAKPEAMERFGIASLSPLKRWCGLYREGGAEALRPKPKGRPRGSGAKAPKTREEELEERVRKLEAQVAYLKKSIALKAELRSRTGRRP